MASRLSSFKRTLRIDIRESRSAILYGPRKVGKTTFLRINFSKSILIDLLKSDLRASFQINPSRLREMVLEQPSALYILDEIQKVPTLLEEVHWCLENTTARFILCGSSARKLKRGSANLLGGRAFKYELFPLTSEEVPDFDLVKAINHGCIPQHYTSKNPQKFLKSYVEQYIQEEIIEESQIRKLASFQRFLQVAAQMNGELLNFANVGADCGVSGKTVREYYQILEDTLLGFTLSAWVKVKTRKLIETSKFYLFDTGVIRYLKELDFISVKTVEFGNSFETLLINEVRAYLSYRQSSLSMSYWRTTSGLEVDLIVGQMKVACEFKSTDKVRRDHLRGLKAILEEHNPDQLFLVSLDPVSRKLENGIRHLHYKKFLSELWAGRIV
ncbi:MAG: ATP-binding protein [Bdellovibrionaceae bacterium]|nr:ATP-binding protein [Pseudobdellovibrionaceae bacterium]